MLRSSRWLSLPERRMSSRCALFGARSATWTRAKAQGLHTLESTSREIGQVTQRDIRSVIAANRYQYVVGHASFLMQCPFCEKGQKSAEKTFFVNKTTGSVVCKPCSVRGETATYVVGVAGCFSPAPFYGLQDAFWGVPLAIGSVQYRFCNISLCTPAHPCTPLHTPAYPCTPLHTPAHSCTLLHTPAHSCTPLHTPAHPCTPLHTPTGSWSDFLQWIKDARKQHRSRSSVPVPSVTPQTSHEVASSHEGAQKVWETTVSWDSTSPDIANKTKQVFKIQVLSHCCLLI